jgi:hypothetical protein
MKRIILISCVSQKLNKSAKAKELYISPLFRKNFRYAEILYPEHIFILSAKYGLVKPDDEIAPYDATLNKMSAAEKKEWAAAVVVQLKRFADLQNDEFIFLAGENYRKYIIPEIQKYYIPMEGLGIGKQLQWLTQKIKHEQLLSSAP